MKKSLKFLLAALVLLGINFSLFAQNSNIAFTGFGGGLPSTAVSVNNEAETPVNSILLNNSGTAYTTSEYLADECCYHLTDALIEVCVEIFCELFCNSCSATGTIPMLFTAPIYSE